MKYIFLLLASFLISLLSSGAAKAQSEQGGLAVSPAFQEVTFAADSSQVEFEVTIKNRMSNSVVIRPTIVDFGSLDESGGVAFLGQTKDVGQKYALASWIHPEKDVLFLESGETEVLRMTIENRETLSPGGHYASILLKVGEEEAVQENAVAVQQMVSVLVLAKKKGGEIYNLGFKEGVTSKNPFFLPSQVRLRFQNYGNVHIVPRGTVTLTDFLGREVAKGIINPESSFLLPETLRIYPVTLKKTALAFLPGKYQLAIQYRYDGKEETTPESLPLFLFPWPAGVVIGGSIMAGVFFRRQLRKKASNKA